MKSLHSILIENGLSDKQALVYLTLLELNEALPSVLAKKSGLKRPTVYVILDQLIEVGLVSHTKRKNSTYYSPIDPKSFFEDRQRKLDALSLAIPELITLNQRFEASPKMIVFEGEQGITQVREDTLNAEDEILCWSNVDLAVNTVLVDYHPRYLQKKLKKKITTKCLFLYDERALEMKRHAEEELREVYLIPRDKFPFDNEINIYNDKMSIISHKDKVGVIIQNQAIADTQRSIFNFAFEYAKLLEPQILTKEHKKEFGY